MNKVVPFRGKLISPEEQLSKKIAKSSMDLLLSEADLLAETPGKVELTASFQIIRIIASSLLLPPLTMGKIVMLNAGDKTRLLIIEKSKSGRVYKADFGKKKKPNT